MVTLTKAKYPFPRNKLVEVPEITVKQWRDDGTINPQWIAQASGRANANDHNRRVLNHFIKQERRAVAVAMVITVIVAVTVLYQVWFT